MSMAELVLIYGKSGSGKSRSICSFGDDEVFIYQCESKRLPTRTNYKYMAKMNPNKVDKKTGMYVPIPSQIESLKKMLKRMPTKAAVIDDLTYVMTNLFMGGHREKAGSKSFDLYDDIADSIWSLFRFIKDELDDDTIVYIVMHEDTNDYGDTKLKTIGKLLDNKVCLEGMVTICLRCISSMGNHSFKTATDGNDITKSPEGMFSADEIPNDLKAVDTTIREFYGMAPLTHANIDNTTAEADEKESA